MLCGSCKMPAGVRKTPWKGSRSKRLIGLRRREATASARCCITWPPSRPTGCIPTSSRHRNFPRRSTSCSPQDVRDEQGVLSQARGETLLEHYTRLEVVRSHLLQAFQGMSAEDYRRPREFDDYAVTPDWVLHHLMQHEAEHRGQIGELRVRAEGERKG